MPIEGIGEAPAQKLPIFECSWDTCCNCGTSSMWKLKKVGTWICEACHPPLPGLDKRKIEHRKRGDISDIKKIKESRNGR